jgi:hypothetical protein
MFLFQEGRVLPSERIIGADVIERVVIVLVNRLCNSISHDGCKKVSTISLSFRLFRITYALLQA